MEMQAQESNKEPFKFLSSLGGNQAKTLTFDQESSHRAPDEISNK
jgi:hypothetical protein